MISFKDRNQPFQLVARYADLSQCPGGTSPEVGKSVTHTRTHVHAYTYTYTYTHLH